jgi:hypothetical protein
MIWNFIKKILLFALIGMSIAAALIHFSPKSFNDKLVERCSSASSGMGLCAGKKLPKGSSIGMLLRIEKTQQPKYTNYGSLIKKSLEHKNVELIPLYINDSVTDFYAYTTRDIEEGEEFIRTTGL